jgi:hypothetical protein
VCIDMPTSLCSSDRLVLVTAHGRVTSGYPTIELCACARYLTARLHSFAVTRLILDLTFHCYIVLGVTCPLVIHLKGTLTFVGLFTSLVIGDVLMEHRVLLVLY